MEDDLAASIDLAIELGAVAAHGKTLSVVLRAFGAAVHEIAQDASIDLETALAAVASEARAIERFNKDEMNG